MWLLAMMSAEAWTAVATWVLAVATSILVVVAYRQIREARAENRKTQTLAACGNYDLNSVIVDCQQKIWNARIAGTLESDAKKLRIQIVTLLNFFDAIAIGIDQGLYIEALAFDHLQGIIARHVKELIDAGVLDKAEVDKANYVRLIDLRDRWARARPRFQDGSRRRKTAER